MEPKRHDADKPDAFDRPWLKTLGDVLEFVSKAHASRTRQPGVPDINHLIECFNILVQADIVDNSTLCAALLHDVLEDTDTTYEDLSQRFGKEIADIVLECTDKKGLSPIEKKQAQMEDITKLSNPAKLVKLADKLSNCSGLITSPPPFWSENEIMFYMAWCRKLVEQVKGLNHILDMRLFKTFLDGNIARFSNDMLNHAVELYYLNIKNSD
jgi:guanosine-3',5'-bis(diphosphate) 3'-pyrophosphohydrolase